MTVTADAPACVATLDGGDEAWSAAVGTLDLQLGDCKTIDVRVTKEGAVLIYVARDGRVAVRRLASPGELAPTIEALRVALPPETAVVAPIAKLPPKRAEPVVVAPTVAIDLPPRVQLALYGGARIAWPGTFASPLLGASGSLGVGAFTLGVYGEWETGYASGSRPLPSDVQLFGIAAGVSIGRRIFDRSLLVEARIGGAVMTAEASEANEYPEDERAEARLGLHLRASLPASSPVRARVALGVELSPTVLAQKHRAIDPSLPDLPVWALVLSVGFEADASGGP